MKIIDKISLLLACMLLFEHIGLAIIYQCQSISHKEQIKEFLEKDIPTQTLTFTPKVFENYRINKKELLINGRYFDIKKMVSKDQQICVTGIWDDQEKQLKNQVNQMVAVGFCDKAVKLYPILYTPCILVSTGLPFIGMPQNDDFPIHFYLDGYSYYYFPPLIKPPVA